MFENKIINGYTYATRYIISWIRAGGKLGRYGENYSNFKQWLKSLNLSDEDIDHIMFLAANGKMELELSAEDFLKTENLK